MFSYEKTLVTFSASEAAAITGVSPALQRTWRKRKALPAIDDGKHMRFDVCDLARLIAVKLLSDRLDISESAEIAEISARGIAFHALRLCTSYDGEIDDQFLETLESQAVSVLRLKYGKVGGVIPGNFLILWADGSELWETDLTRAFDNASGEQQAGPVVVLDLETFGYFLSRRHPGAFVYVKRVSA